MTDQQNRVLKGFSRADCDVFRGDCVRHRLTWKGAADIRVTDPGWRKLRFFMRSASLYSFQFEGKWDHTRIGCMFRGVQMRRQRLTWLLSLLALCVGSVSAQNAPPWHSEVDYDFFAGPQEDIDADPVVRVEPETPHGFELKPYAKGKIKALVFVDGWKTAPREIAELAQRFDTDIDLVYVTQVAGRTQVYPGHGEQRLDRLLEKDHDVYVFANVLAGNWPPDTRHRYDFVPEHQMAKIVDRVKGGAGVVCTGGVPDGFFLSAEKPMQETPGRLVTGSVIAQLSDYSGILARMKRRDAPITDRSAAEALIRAYKIGEGRGVHVGYPNTGQMNALVPMLPHSDTAQVEYDHWMAWIGKAILWAAGKESDLNLAFSPEDPVFRQDAQPANLIKVDLVRRERVAAPLKVRPRIVSRYSDVWDLPELTVEPGADSCSVSLPRLPAGDYFLDVTCATDRGELGIWSKSLTVASDVRIEQIVLRDLCALPGKELEGRLRLHNVFKKPGRELCVYLRDSFGRDLERVTVALPTTWESALYYGHEWQRQMWYVYPDGKADQYEELPFSVKVPENATLSMTAIAVLTEDGETIDAKRAHFNAPVLDYRKFFFFQWDPPSDYLGYHAFKRLNENGWNAAVTMQGRSSGVAVACNMPAVRYVVRVLDRVLPDGIMDGRFLTSRPDTPIPWNSELMNRHIKDLARAYTQMKREGILAYSMGDEVALRGADLSPEDLEAYREHLERRYGSIDGLNDSWETTYKSFEEVELLKFGEVMRRYVSIDRFNKMKGTSFKTWEEAKEAYGGAYGASYKIKADIYQDWAFLVGDYPRWYDRQAFARYNFGELLSRFADALREYDPGAVVGCEGTRSIWGHRINFNTYDGIWRNRTAVANHDDLVERTGFLGMGGDDPVSDVLQALASPNDIHIAQRWLHGSDMFDSMAAQVWDALAMGHSGIGFCIWQTLYEGAMTKGLLESTSLDLMPHTGKPLADETAVIRMGLGDLLANLRFADDGVAMLYSMPSNFMGWADGNSAYGHFDLAHCAWAYVNRELGVGYQYVTEKMVQRGALEESKPRVLILPYALALEEKTVDEIRAFVESGGALVADVRPAVYSGHCKKLAHGALDDLLGIKTARRGEAESAKLSGEVAWGDEVCSLTDLATSVEAGISLDGGEAGYRLDRTPLMIAHQAREGRTLLLNFHLDAFMRERSSKGSDNVRRLLSSIYSALGIEPHVQSMTLNGGPAREVEARIWENGQIIIMSLQKKLPYEWIQKPDNELRKLFKMHRIAVRLPKPYCVSDISKGTNLSRTLEFETTVRTGYARFFALLPAEEPGLKLMLSQEVLQPGETSRLTIGLDEGGTVPRGLRAHYLQRYDPSGNEAVWGRQVLLADEGGREVRIQSAYNDAPGAWKITVTSLFGAQSTDVSYHIAGEAE